jgi:alpha-amylase
MKPLFFSAALLAGQCLAQGAAAQPTIDISPVAATNRSSALQPGWEKGAFMEIFVRAWRDSNGDGIGDLRGLTQSLDYLLDLGIRGIWLMPVLKNGDGDHGYATTDYRDIAPEYGTLADFDELIREAHKRNIGVVMDYVINHSSAQHPMFKEALKGPGNPFHDWFVWSQDLPQGWDIWGKNPWYLTAAEPWNFKGEAKDLPPPPPGAQGFYFGTFGPHMPDFNLRKPEVLAYHQSSLRFWLNRGLDGYRLDAVPHMIENSAKDWNDQPESRAMTKQLQDLIKRYDQRMVVCEATAEPQAYGDDAICGGAFAFGYVHHIVRAARGDPESVEMMASYYRKASPNMATFVSNHDSFAGQRLWDQVGGNLAIYRLAAATYLLQPGTPYIYYGEEIGQGGVLSLKDDPIIRSPMSWTADPATAGFTTGQPFRPVSPNAATNNAQAQQRDPNSIFAFYKAMLKLRNGLPSIARGSFEHSFAEGQVAGWQRSLGGETTFTVFNYGPQAAEVAVDRLPPNTRMLAMWPEDAETLRVGGSGRVHLTLPGQSLRVYRLQKLNKETASWPKSN